MAKISLFFLYFLFFFSISFSSVFAQSASKDDCEQYASLDAPGYVQRVMKEVKPTFFRQKDLERALDYIQGSCCEYISNDSLCPPAKKKQIKYYAQSRFMFDQLVTIGMKKLDAIQDHCDTLGIECHPLAKEWRTEITKIAEDRKGVPPSLIMTTFEKYRGKTPQTYLNGTDKVSYAYQLMCREADDIYTSIGLATSATTLQQGTQTRIQRCQALIAKRFQQEAEYIRTLQVEKAMKYYMDNIDSYINKYFVQNRGETLMDTFEAINTCFTPVLKRIDRTINCSMRGQK